MASRKTNHIHALIGEFKATIILLRPLNHSTILETRSLNRGVYQIMTLMNARL
jgi:hypothetical protein